MNWRLVVPARCRRRVDDGDERAQDPVLVERRHRRQHLLEPRHHRRRRIRRSVEQLEQRRRDRGVVGERLIDVLATEGRAALAQVLPVRAQQRDLAPAEPRREHQPTERIGVRRPSPE